jgi:acyl dehydratase
MSAIPSRPVALAPGDLLPARTIGPLTRTDIVRYAGAGGDLNPIHHDEPMARDSGMPTVFAMGLLHGGMLGMQLARWVGPDHVRAFALRFTGQVWPGDTLRFTGTVDSVDDAGVAALTLTVERAPGDVVVRATAQAQTAGG